MDESQKKKLSKKNPATIIYCIYSFIGHSGIAELNLMIEMRKVIAFMCWKINLTGKEHRETFWGDEKCQMLMGGVVITH